MQKKREFLRRISFCFAFSAKPKKWQNKTKFARFFSRWRYTKKSFWCKSNSILIFFGEEFDFDFVLDNFILNCLLSRENLIKVCCLKPSGKAFRIVCQRLFWFRSKGFKLNTFFFRFLSLPFLNFPFQKWNKTTRILRAKN